MIDKPPTTTAAVAVLPLIEPVAVMVTADPEDATPVTTPLDDTLATEELEELHVIVSPGRVELPERATVSPTPMVVLDAGVTEMLTTVTRAVSVSPLAEPRAVMVTAEPDAARPVTTPLDDTLAIEGLEELHVMVSPEMVEVAERDNVLPTNI